MNIRLYHLVDSTLENKEMRLESLKGKDSASLVYKLLVRYKHKRWEIICAQAGLLYAALIELESQEIADIFFNEMFLFLPSSEKRWARDALNAGEPDFDKLEKVYWDKFGKSATQIDQMVSVRQMLEDKARASSTSQSKPEKQLITRIRRESKKREREQEVTIVMDSEKVIADFRAGLPPLNITEIRKKQNILSEVILDTKNRALRGRATALHSKLDRIASQLLSQDRP